MISLIWFLIVLLVVLWVLGLAANVGGNLIWLLLVLAVILLLYNLFYGRRVV